MDPVRNPFAPGAGNPPPELAGRSAVLDDVGVTLRRIALAKPAQSSILVGLRGVGKTVLLTRIDETAQRETFKTLYIEAHEDKSLPELLVPGLRRILISLSVLQLGRNAARQALRVLSSFVRSIKLKVHDIDLELGIDPEVGSADSGDLEADLPSLFLSIGQAAKSAGIPIVILIDEMQYLKKKEFSALIMAIHRTSQANLPVTLVGAGLPQILGLAGDSKSYAERLFKYPKIGALDEHDARDAILGPIQAEKATIDDAAISEILSVTERYPYFLQQWGHEAWNIASNNRISRKDVLKATSAAIVKLDESFFRVRFGRCTPTEKRYMRALAELGPGTHRSGEIAEKLSLKTTNVGPTRDKLIRKGMIYSPQHGDTAFTVPLFDAYMRRVMPTLD